MSKKHFEALAEALKNQKPDYMTTFHQSASLFQWKADCRAIADACQNENPRFDRERFLSACDVS